MPAHRDYMDEVRYIDALLEDIEKLTGERDEARECARDWFRVYAEAIYGRHCDDWAKEIINRLPWLKEGDESH